MEDGRVTGLRFEAEGDTVELKGTVILTSGGFDQWSQWMMGFAKNRGGKDSKVCWFVVFFFLPGYLGEEDHGFE